MIEKQIVITGGTSGLGRQIVKAMTRAGNKIINLDVLMPFDGWKNAPQTYRCDITDDRKVMNVAFKITSNGLMPLDILINCAGINYIDWIENITEEIWDRVMDVNAKGIFNTCKAFLGALKNANGTILNIISNASHMPMTNSIVYNASKAAAHMMTLQMSRELSPQGITVFGISPNKLAGTGMSRYIDKTVTSLRGWTEDEAMEYQLKSLPAGEETDPATLAEFIDFILSSKQRHKYMAGTVIPYGN